MMVKWVRTIRARPPSVLFFFSTVSSLSPLELVILGYLRDNPAIFRPKLPGNDWVPAMAAVAGEKGYKKMKAL